MPGDVISDLVGPSECWVSWLVEHPPAVPTSTTDAVSCGDARSAAGPLFAVYVPISEGPTACPSARTAVYTWHGLKQFAFQKPWAPFGWTYFTGATFASVSWSAVWERSDQKVIALGVNQGAG